MVNSTTIRLKSKPSISPRCSDIANPRSIAGLDAQALSNLESASSYDPNSVRRSLRSCMHQIQTARVLGASALVTPISGFAAPPGFILSLMNGSSKSAPIPVPLQRILATKLLRTVAHGASPTREKSAYPTDAPFKVGPRSHIDREPPSTRRGNRIDGWFESLTHHIAVQLCKTLCCAPEQGTQGGLFQHMLRRSSAEEGNRAEATRASRFERLQY